MDGVEALNVIAEGIITFDAAGRVTFANEAATACTGLDPHGTDTRGSCIADWTLCHAESGEPFPAEDDPWRQALAGRPVRQALGVFRRGDGDKVWLRVSAIPVKSADGGVREVVASLVDVTAEWRHLREVEDRLRLVGDTLNMGLAIRDHEGKIVYVNRGVAEWFGMGSSGIEGHTPAELLTNSRWRFYDSNGTELAPQAMPGLQALKTGESQNDVVICFENPAGVRRWMKSDNVVVRGPDGRIQAVVSSFVDVTDIKLAEARLQQAYDAAVCGILVRDQSQRLVQVNRAAADIMGVDPQSLVGTSGYEPEVEIETDTGQPWALEDLPTPTVFRTGIPVRDAIMLLKRPNAEPRWFQVGAAPVLGEDGQIEQVVSSWVDITAQKQAEAASRLAAERWQSLFEGICDAVVVYQGETVLMMNRAAEELFGWSLTEVAGKRFPLESGPDQASLESATPRLLEGQTAVYEADYVTKLGQLVPVEASVFPWKDKAGRTAGGIAIFRDLSTQRQLDEQARLISVYEERNRIAMDLHDGVIQTLYALRVNVSAARRSASDRRDDLLQVIDLGLDEAIRSLRDYVSGLYLTSVGTGELSARLEALCRGVPEGLDVRLDVAAASEVEQLLGAQASANLLQIAREALSNVVRHSQATAATVALTINQSRVRLAVQDNGRGFDPDNTGRRVGDGTRNMRKRAQILSADLTIDSTLGAGTTVLLELPLT